MRDDGSDLFFPDISMFGPWSGEILRNGRPKVKLIALNLNKVLIGESTWSWYIPITESYLIIFFFKKKVSAGYGPSTLIPFFLNYL